MAGFGEIPIPKQFSSMGELADLLMKKRTEQERSRQFNEQHKIALSQEARQQELQPFHIQQMKDTHSTSMLNNLVSRKAMERAEATLPYVLQQYQDTHKGKVSEQGLADVKNEVYRRSYQHELDKLNEMQQQQDAAAQAAIPQNEPGNFLTQGQRFPSVSPEAQKANVIPFQPQVSPQAQAEQVNNPMMQQAPGMNQQALSTAPNASPMLQQGNQPIGQEVTISPGDPNLSYKNIEGKPSQIMKNGYLITTYPDQKVTARRLPADMVATQRGMSLEDKMKLEEYKAKLKVNAAGTEFDKNISKEDAKNLSQLNKNLFVAREIQPNIDYMRSLANSPEMQVIKQNPLLFGKDKTYFEKSKEHKAEAKVIGKMTAVQKNMYADMAQKFKGAFRKGEQELFDRLLPSDSDTIDVMIGKIQGMDMLNRAVIQRLSRVDDLVRDRDNKMTINHAMEQADKEYPIAALEKQIEQEYGSNEMVSVKDNHTGKITKMTRAEFNKLAEEHNG